MPKSGGPDLGAGEGGPRSGSGEGSAVSGQRAPLSRPSLTRGPPSPAEGGGRRGHLSRVGAHLDSRSS
ncbi:hypothetical protein FV230_25545 [Methylobacterium sp. WL6]|nr:hypothetical protein FV230_25545 [Methylobacterium sp. WL6]